MAPNHAYPLGELTLAESNYTFVTLNPLEQDQARTLVAYQQQGGKLYAPAKIPSTLANPVELSHIQSIEEKLQNRYNIFAEADLLSRGVETIKRLFCTSHKRPHLTSKRELKRSKYETIFESQTKSQKTSFSWHPSLPKFAVVLEDDTIAFGNTIELPLHEHTLLSSLGGTSAGRFNTNNAPQSNVMELIAKKQQSSLTSSELQWDSFVLAHANQKNVSQIKYNPAFGNIIAVACEGGVGLWVFSTPKSPLSFSKLSTTTTTATTSSQTSSHDVPLATKPRTTDDATDAVKQAREIISTASTSSPFALRSQDAEFSTQSIFEAPISAQLPSITKQDASNTVSLRSAQETEKSTQSTDKARHHTPESHTSHAFFAFHSTNSVTDPRPNPVHSLSFSPCGRFLLFATKYTVEVISVHDTIASSLSYEIRSHTKTRAGNNANVDENENENENENRLSESQKSPSPGFLATLTWMTSFVDRLRESILEQFGQSQAFSSRSEVILDTFGKNIDSTCQTGRFQSLTPGVVSFSPDGANFIITSRSTSVFHLGVTKDWSLATFNTPNKRPIRSVTWAPTGVSATGEGKKKIHANGAKYTQVLLLATHGSSKLHALSIYPGKSSLPRPVSLFTQSDRATKSSESNKPQHQSQQSQQPQQSQVQTSLNMTQLLKATIGSFATLADSLVVSSKVILDISPLTAWAAISSSQTAKKPKNSRHSQDFGRHAEPGVDIDAMSDADDVSEVGSDSDNDDSGDETNTPTLSRPKRNASALKRGCVKPRLVINNIVISPGADRLAITLMNSEQYHTALSGDKQANSEPCASLQGEELVIIAEMSFDPLLRCLPIGMFRGPPRSTTGHQSSVSGSAAQTGAGSSMHSNSILSSGLRRQVGYGSESTLRRPKSRMRRSSARGTVEDVDDDVDGGDAINLFGSMKQTSTTTQQQQQQQQQQRNEGVTMTTSLVNRPRTIAFNPRYGQGSLLALVWENGLITYFPLITSKNQNISRASAQTGSKTLFSPQNI